ncbi:Oxoglutarate-dependent flavonoid 7-O-demethylase 1 [Castilleja foliolosa]|uniref:Oxoglutarate-dependent flavonoid 7-O-demethylase 1 n=1 Tax=Castilleja foliolosa TaxID=1961234 RepID=A0ABD3DPN1_9LAMI
MESNSRKLGGSLKVPIVQELAKETLATVPPRYVRLDRDDQDHPLPSNYSLPQIPVVDFQKLFDPDFTDIELHKLHYACQEWGFFQVINHGVDNEVIESMKLEIEGFFNLPIEEKKKYNQEAGDVEGYGQAFVVSEEQKLDWADMFFIFTLPTHLRKQHLIPKLPATFRNAIESYSAEMKALAMEILNQMGKALKMKPEEMKNVFDEEGVKQSMRMNYYPACPQPELVTGLCPHSDASGLTILLQVNETQGLQIKKDGLWVPVSPIPGAFVINIGDILEILTNGIYRSIEHRATVNGQKERLSIATFLSPKLENEVGPSTSLLGPESPAKYKTITVADFLRGLFSRELEGKSYLDTLRI